MVKKTLLAALLVAAATISFAPVATHAQTQNAPGMMTGRGDNQNLVAATTKKAAKHKKKAKKKAKKAKKVKKAKKAAKKS